MLRYLRELIFSVFKVLLGNEWVYYLYVGFVIVKM